MYEIVKVLEEKRFTPTRAMTVILAKCCHCGAEKEILEQNLQRSNREKRKHCEEPQVQKDPNRSKATREE